MSNKEQVCDGGAAVAGMVFCGIDVSATRLDVAVQREGLDGFRRRQFANLDVALALDEAGVEVAAC